MTKNILFYLLLMAIFSGCGNNEKTQENALLDSVKNAHDKVMGDDAMNMKVRMKLKGLLARKPQLKDSINYFLKQMDDNDNVMMDWMNKFNPDFTGKSHDQIISYLTDQKKQVIAVDSQLKQGALNSTDFLIRNSRK